MVIIFYYYIMSKSNLAEEFLFEEKITDEEFSNLQLDYNIDNYCYINEIDKIKYLTILKSNTLLYSKIPQNNNIKISQNYIIKKIILHNVPESNYLLIINCENAATFVKINKNDIYYDYEVNIEYLTNNVIDKYKSCSEYESHVNLMKIDNFTISYQKNTNFNCEYIYYSLYGIKYDEINDKYEKINTKYKYYLKTIKLNFSHPTMFIDLILKKNNPNKPSNIYFYIDGIMIKNIIINNDDFNTCRINFDNIQKLIKKKYTIEDKYLSSFMVSKTINLSYVNDIQIAYNNVIIERITQFYFNTYSLPHMSLMFSD